MLKPEQIPDEAVKAALKAWKKDTETFHPNAGTIAAAINAWPGMAQKTTAVGLDVKGGKVVINPHIILPLPQEPSDE